MSGSFSPPKVPISTRHEQADFRPTRVSSDPMKVPRNAVPIGNERRQRLRIRRFAFASVFSILFVVVLAVFYTQDKVDRATLIHAGVLVFAFIVVFFCLFRTGLNLRFSDPSLTGWQFLAAVATMLYVVYRAPETRLAFTAFFFVALMFGMLRRDSKRVAVLGSVSVVLFRAVGGPALYDEPRRRDVAARHPPVPRDGSDISVDSLPRGTHASDAAGTDRGAHQAGGHRGKGAPRRSHRRLQPSRSGRRDARLEAAGRRDRRTALDLRDRPRSLQALQRRVRPSDRRSGLAHVCAGGAGWAAHNRLLRALRRRGIRSDSAANDAGRSDGRCRATAPAHQHARTADVPALSVS